jgi:hypothetical protein
MANRITNQAVKSEFCGALFLGDNKNAIKVQIYYVLIVNLLIAVIKKKLKQSWEF